MTQATVAGEIHQALDVHRGFATKITLDREVGVDRFADLQDFGVRQVLYATAVIDAELVGDLESLGTTDTMDVGERDDNALVGRDVYPGNTSHLNLHAPQGAP